jgi:ring-1,2-phenylacetyl-CoA epoxidase subunit PaaA/ring-1,2-phenylacetyl-CoA epoxidase subunit PaaC
MAAAAPADRLIAAIAAVKTDLAWLYTDWSVRAPTLESSTAITAMAQEEVGHARVLGGLVDESVEGERIACLREPVASWPELLGTVAPAELALAELARALGACRHDALRARVRKMADEERFHELFVEGWSALLEDDAPDVTAAFRQALGRAQEQTAAWIERLDADAAAGDVLDAGALAERCLPRVAAPGRVDVA